MRRLVQLLSRIFSSEPKTGQIGSIEFNLWLINVTGIPLMGLRKESPSSKAFFLIYGILAAGVLAFIYTGFEIYDLWDCRNDLDALTQNACLLCTHIGALIKVINTFYRYKDLREVIEQLGMISKKFIISKNQRKTFFDGQFENILLTVIFVSAVGFSTSLSLAMLVYNPQAIIKKKIFPYRVLLPAWLPYPLQLAYIFASLLVFSIQIVAMDCLNINLINQIRFQLKALNVSFEELTIDGSKNPFEERKMIRITGKHVTPQQHLHDIIEHHCHLMRIHATIESIYRYPVLVQFLLWLLVFAMVGFQAVINTDVSNDFPIIYFYFCSIFIQMFFYCWFGNEVAEQSKSLTSSGYNSTWYQFDQRFRKTLLVFLLNAQRPFIFTAGGLMDLSLQSFMGILKNSYTFAAVLQQLYGR